jgi:hypothetical protein
MFPSSADRNANPLTNPTIIIQPQQANQNGNVPLPDPNANMQQKKNQAPHFPPIPKRHYSGAKANDPLKLSWFAFF